MNDTYELLFKVREEGQDRLDQIESRIRGVSTETKAGSESFDEFRARLKAASDQSVKAAADVANLGGNLRNTAVSAEVAGAGLVSAGEKAASLTANIVGIGVASSVIATTIVGAVSVLGELYNSYNPILVAQAKSLKILEDTGKEYESLIEKSERLRFKELERSRGKDYVLSLQSDLAKGDAKSAQVLVDQVQDQIKALDARITAGTRGATAPTTRIGKGGAEVVVPGSPGSLSTDAQAAQRERIGREAELEIAILKQKLFLQESAEKEAELAKLRLDKQKAANSSLDAIQRQYEALLASLTKAGLSPLARFQIDYGNNRTALDGKITAEQGARLDEAATAAFRREVHNLVNKDDFSPTETSRMFRGLNSKGTGLAIPSFTAPPLEQREESIAPNSSTKILADLNERRVAGIQRSVEYQQQLIRLISGSGGEIEAINRVAALRADAAEREFAITKDRAKYEAEVDQARYDRTVQILELQKRELDKYKEQARGVFRALTAGGTGTIESFIKGQGAQLAEQLFVNTSGKTFQKFGGALGSLGAKSGLPGWLLEGTIFDPKNKDATSATVDNTTVTVDNTAATNALTAALGGTPTSGGGVGSVVSAVGGIFSGAQSNPLIFRNNAGVGTDGSGVNGEWGTPVGPSNGPGTELHSDGLSRTQRGIGIVGAGAAGAFGIWNGLKEGGARGGVEAVGSGAGAAGSILALAGVSGPAAPILAGIGLGLGIARQLFPDPKQQRDKELNRMLSDAQFQAPESVSRTFDLMGGGEGFDYDYRGKLRGGTTNVTVNVSAMDSKSFLDRSADLAAGIRRALQNGDPLSLQIRQTVGVN